MSTIGINRSSLYAQRQLGQASDAVNSSFQKLSSGLRINNASDDAAGLVVSTSLKSDSRLFGQAIRNVNDGVSLLNIAEGALDNLSSITARQLELAEQASNGTYTLAQRRALQAESSALTSEFNRIVSTTTFNGTAVLRATDNSVALQIGTTAIGTITFQVGEELDRTVGSGTFQAKVSFGRTGARIDAADLNGDGKIDLFATTNTRESLDVLIGNGDGTFKASVSFATGPTTTGMITGDFNGDGSLDVASADQTGTTFSILLGNGDGTFKARTSYATSSNPFSVATADYNGDGKLDIVSADGTSGLVSVAIGNGDGTFKGRVTYLAGSNTQNVITHDVSGDSIFDIVAANNTGDSVSILLGNGDGSFKSKTDITGSSFDGARGLAIQDLNFDGLGDLIVTARDADKVSILLSNGDGSFRLGSVLAAGRDPVAVAVGDINGDGFTDLSVANNAPGALITFLGNGDGTFKAYTSYSVGGNNGNFSKIIDVNGDGAADIVEVDGLSVGVLLANTTDVVTIGAHNLLTQADARTALTNLTLQRDRITSELGAVGALQSRLHHTTSILEVTRENYLAAKGRIEDVDVAEESTKLVASQVRQQAATAILAQANQQPGLVLRLLQ